jgi:hypothetical protein
MKANELRIGNYVNEAVRTKISRKISTYEITKIRALNIHHLEMFPISKNFEPIQLTEEWVKTLGFKLVFAGQGDGFIYECGQLCNAMNIYSRNRNVFLYSTFNSCEINIKYVHQLQNLYFALTGEELSL